MDFPENLKPQVEAMVLGCVNTACNNLGDDISVLFASETTYLMPTILVDEINDKRSDAPSWNWRQIMEWVWKKLKEWWDSLF